MRAHIVDKDVKRRAKLARSFFDKGWHAEVFEGFEEFSDYSAKSGFVFAHDEPDHPCSLESYKIMDADGGRFPVIMYSEKPDLELVVRAMVAGALDYFEWPIPDDKIDALIADAKQREIVRQKELAVKDEAEALVANLTGREREVVSLITRGLSNKAIATELSISPRTVEIHRANAFSKINAGSTADAVRIGVHAGLDRD